MAVDEGMSEEATEAFLLGVAKGVKMAYGVAHKVLVVDEFDGTGLDKVLAQKLGLTLDEECYEPRSSHTTGKLCDEPWWPSAMEDAVRDAALKALEELVQGSDLQIEGMRACSYWLKRGR
jgi:hypothetical protein